jgi:cbb3-type cytochrome oxidase subunit 3
METFFNAFDIDGNAFFTIFFYAILFYNYDN